EAWQTAEVGGPKKALAITKPEVVAAMIKRAKRPILVVGHKAAETKTGGKTLLDDLIEIAEKGHVPIVATGHAISDFLKKGYKKADWMPAVDIGNRLADAEWKGLDGKGQYDLALFVGLPYYMEWTILSGLKSFAPNLKTITLDRTYQPNASWSFPNLPEEKWIESLEIIIANLGGK
ncbi:MAG: CO dehydrogenase/acetyl-CoA synthase complex subunit epsilon, partial [Candidatus Bathyarchaeia archaeon]